jgi:hypothetical protein
MNEPAIKSINALTLPTQDMRQAVRFYAPLEFALDHGGEDGASATSTSAIQMGTS